VHDHEIYPSRPSSLPEPLGIVPTQPTSIPPPAPSIPARNPGFD